jgi:hypothetical protein
MNNLDNYYNEMLHLSGTITSVISIFPIVIGLFYFKFFNKPLKVFFGYLVFGLMLNILAELFIWSVNISAHYNSFWKPILEALKIEDTNFFNGISYFSIFLFLGWFYFLLMEEAKFSNYIKWICIVLCVFQIFNYLFLDGFRAKGAIGHISSSIFTLLISALYLWYLSNKPPDLSIWNNTYFLISIALFVISTISLAYSFSTEALYESDFVLYCKIKIARNAVNMLTEIIYIIAFTKAKYLKYL